MNQTKASRGSLIGHRPHGSWQQGWEEIGDKRCYFRSRWEVNYACYLEFLKKSKQLLDWDYEPETFWFDKIKRGTNNYTPDFKITWTPDRIEFHEVKGWMDARSKTKINRMRIYHPDTVLVVIDKLWFKSHKHLYKVIPGWRKSRY